MSTAENKEISRRLFEQVWNEGKVEMLESFHTPDWVIKDPYNTVPASGLEGAKQYVMSYRKAFPDLNFRIDEQVAEGETVVNFLTATGTHEGVLLGLPPSHKKASVSAVVKLRFRNGKIAESTSLWDALTFMRIAGGTEMPQAAAATARA